MPFKFPYTNFQELNLDWIIKKVKDLSKQIEDDSSIVAEYIDRLLAVEEKADNADATATAADARATGANNTANSALTLATQAKQIAEIADLSTTLLGLKIGDLSSLYTTAKDTIVNAINEVWSIFHNATAVTNVTPAGTDPAVTYSNGVFTFNLPEGGDPDAVTHAELDAAIDDVEDTIDALTDRVDGLEDDIDDLSEELDNKADVIIDTASGDIASFPDGTATPLKSLIVNVEPVQAGTGDPSPNNIRPISGWNGCEVVRTGKNLAKISFSEITNLGVTFTPNNDGSISLNGTSTSTYPQTIINQNISLNYLPKGAQLTLSCVTIGTVPAGAFVYAILYERDTPNGANIVSHSTKSGDSTFTISHDYCILYIVAEGNSKTYNNLAAKVQCEAGNTAIEYEPYTGNSFSVTFNETVYGATPDLVSGEMPVTWAKRIFNGSENWRKESNGNFYSLQFQSGAYVPSGSVGNYICNYLTWAAASSPNFPDTIRFGNSNPNTLYVILPSFADNLEDFKSYLASNNIEICYRIANPTTTSITPTPITALKGYNAIWSDAGAVEVTYRADTKGYIDKLIAQVQALALGG